MYIQIIRVIEDTKIIKRYSRNDHICHFFLSKDTDLHMQKNNNP